MTYQDTEKYLDSSTELCFFIFNVTENTEKSIILCTCYALI